MDAQDAPIYLFLQQVAGEELVALTSSSQKVTAYETNVIFGIFPILFIVAISLYMKYMQEQSSCCIGKPDSFPHITILRR